MWHYILSRSWRNLRNIEIDRNWRSEKLLKLGGSKKVLLIFRERGAGGGLSLWVGGQKFSFQRGAFPMGGWFNFLVVGSFPSAYYTFWILNHLIIKLSLIMDLVLRNLPQSFKTSYDEFMVFTLLKVYTQTIEEW